MIKGFSTGKKATVMHIPEVSFKSYSDCNSSTNNEIGLKINDALTKSGFVALSDFGIPDELLSDVFEASKAFFSLSEEEKKRYAYVSADENFGYQAVGTEHLDPRKPADLKETFTMRNILTAEIKADRWPSLRFEKLMKNFFSEGLKSSHRIQRVLANFLEVDENFFVKAHSGENVALRLLHYPPIKEKENSENQLGAGEHSDYGMFTLLFQDGVEGLEIWNGEKAWIPIESTESSTILNAGDLLERWTNGKYPSTLHRVKLVSGKKDRYSIALFMDPDSEALVDVIESCTSEARPKQFSAISAGAYIQKRLRDSHKTAFTK